MSVGNAVRNPRVFVAGKYNALKILLTDPERFYGDLSVSDRIWNEVLVLFFVGAIGSVGTYFLATQIMSNIVTGPQGVNPGQSGDFAVSSDVGIQVWGYAVRAIVGIFVLWVFFGTLLYAVSWLYSARGSYFAMLKNSAWALVPIAFGNLVKTIAFVIAGWNAWDSGTLEATEQDFIADAQTITNFLYNQILGEPVAVAGIALSIVFVAYAGYIASFAAAYVRDIPQSDALKAAAVPTVLYAGYVVYEILFKFTGVLGG